MAGVGEGTVLAERYQLEQKLGEGAMGSVWRAEHLMLGSQVAIKVLDESIAAHSVALARFMREARAAASLKSVHVVQIHDYGVDGQTPYIAMEYLEGETLCVRLGRVRRLTPRETALILTHVARGIGKAHQVGVIHRDLKPDNIFLLKEDDEEFAKVLDFGVAKAGEGVFAATLTSAGKLLGTPAYMSAEQAAGRPVDHRTDIWSLAVIAFECLTGELPFVGDDLPDLLHAIHDGPIPVPSRLGRVPEGFDAWFAKGVARNVDDRFYSAKAMVAELRELCGLNTVNRSTADAATDEDQRSTLTPNEEEDLPESENTNERIARAFRERQEEEPPDSVYDDIIRTQDVLADSVTRPVDDILTDSDFDDSLESESGPIPEASVEHSPHNPLPPASKSRAEAAGQTARPASDKAPPPPQRVSSRRPHRLLSTPPPKPSSRRSPAARDSDRDRVPESEPAPVSASRAEASEVAVEFEDPPVATSEPPSSEVDRRASGPEAATSIGTVVSVRPRRRGQFGLLIAAAIVVVLGTVAGTVAFVLRAPASEASPAARTGESLNQSAAGVAEVRQEVTGNPQANAGASASFQPSAAPVNDPDVSPVSPPREEAEPTGEPPLPEPSP